MKKLNYIALASLAAAITAVSCSKEEMQSSSVSEGTVLTASIAQSADTKTNMSSATENTNVSIVWTAGDKLSVLNGASYGTNSEFTLKTGDEGKTSGSFTGADISGDIIAVYPYASDVAYSTNKVTLNITQTQAFTDKTFAQNSVPMVAKGTVGTNLDFKYLFSAIAFKVNGSGKSVTKVTVAATTPLWGPAEISNLDSTPAITMTGTDSKYYTAELTCATSQDISSDKVFYIAVPAGTYTFAVNVYCSDKTVFHENYTTAKTFTIGKIKYNSTAKAFSDNGPAYVEGSYIGESIKAAGYWWAPVNCGYEPATATYKGYTYGKLYQWGRKYGQGYYKDTYEDATYPSGENITTYWTGTNGSEDSNKFYKGISSGTYNYKNDWIQSGDNTYWNTGTEDAPVKTTDHDPCPAGWRVPTNTELTALLGSATGARTLKTDGTHGTSTNITGLYYDGSTATDPTSGVFLPAAGCRSYSGGNASVRGSGGYYWSSSVDDGKARYLNFGSASAGVYSSYRAYGYSVRCVQE